MFAFPARRAAEHGGTALQLSHLLHSGGSRRPGGSISSVRAQGQDREPERDAGQADRSITASTSVRKAESQRAGFLTCSQTHSYAAHLWRTALSQSHLKPEPRFREQEREFPTWLPRASLTSGHSLLLRRAKYVLLQAFLHKAS